MKKLLMTVLAVSVFMVILTGCDESDENGAEKVKTLWVRHLVSKQNDIGEDITADEFGVYVTGVTLGSLEGNKSFGQWDIFLAGYSPEGKKQWLRQWGTSGRDEGISVSGDFSGCIYVTGYVAGPLPGCKSFGGKDVFLSKFSSKGDLIWTLQWGSEADDEGRGVTVTSSGIYVTGFTEGSFGGNESFGRTDIFLSKIDPDGKKRWTHQYGSDKTDWGNDIAWDETGLYAAGFTMGGIGGNEPFGFDDSILIKFDFTGNVLWVKQWGSSGNDEGNGVAVDSSGVYVCGRSNGDLFGVRRIGMDDAFLVKFDRDGKTLWGRIDGTKTGDSAYGIAVTSTGRICVTGTTGGNLKDKRKTVVPDVFFFLYNRVGKKIFEKQFETGGFEFSRSAAFYGNDLYLTGDTSLGTDGKKNENNNRNIFLIKLRPDLKGY